MRLLIIFAALCAASPALAETRPLTDAEKAALVKEAKYLLKDPDSAQFRWLPKIEGDGAYCAFVNARNSYGGYSGYLPFFGTIDTVDDGRIFASVMELASAQPGETSAQVVAIMCERYGYDLNQRGEE